MGWPIWLPAQGYVSTVGSQTELENECMWFTRFIVLKGKWGDQHGGTQGVLRAALGHPYEVCLNMPELHAKVFVRSLP